MKRELCGFLGAIAIVVPSMLQAKAFELPQPSPQASETLDVGTTELRVDYHRPGVKGRRIWGELVPFGELWRMGANNATKLTVSDPFTVAGKELAAGSYALFAIPGAKSWKVVLNSNAAQWGAYFHKPELDVLTFDVVPGIAPATEWLRYDLTPTEPGKAELAMTWETLRISFAIAVDVNGLTWKRIDSAVADPVAAGFDAWEVYFQAAKYSLTTGERATDAMAWAKKAAAAKDSFWNYELEADLLAREGRYTEAVPLLDQAIEKSVAAGAPEAWRVGARAKRSGWAAKAGGTTTSTAPPKTGA